MNIRGMTAMGNNSPLLIVDGVERSFSNLDPNEIADIIRLERCVGNRRLRGEGG